MDILENGTKVMTADENKIMDAVTGRTVYNIASKDGNTVITDAVTGREEYVISGDVVGGGADTSDATVTAGDVLEGVTAYGAKGKVTGTMPTVTADHTNGVVTVPAGYIAAEQTFNAWDTEDATATPEQVMSGAIFYNADGKQTGTLVPSASSGPTLLAMKFNDSLSIDGNLSEAYVEPLELMTMDAEYGGSGSVWTPQYTEGVDADSKALYFSPFEYNEDWGSTLTYNRWLALPIDNSFMYEDFTVDCWFKTIAGFNNNGLFLGNSNFYIKLLGGGDDNGTGASEGEQNLHAYGSSAFATSPITGNVLAQGLPIGAWHHIAVVRQGNKLNIYVNGNQVWSADYSVDGIRGVSRMFVGDPNCYAVGAIANVRVSKEALWTANFTPPTTI